MRLICHQKKEEVELIPNTPKTSAICKVLSANDTGETGSNQSGILVPKNPEILSFFPKLDNHQKNPRTILKFEDASGIFWNFTFIYYNGKYFGGTRNEYRLTGMTKFFKQNSLKSGDSINFRIEEKERLLVSFERHSELSDKKYLDNKETTTRIKLGNSWRVISI
jgi:hypothetical protein